MGDLIGNGERHLVPPPGGSLAMREEPVPAVAPGRRGASVTVKSAPARPSATRASAPAAAGKARPSILDTIKTKRPAKR